MQLTKDLVRSYMQKKQELRELKFLLDAMEKTMSEGVELNTILRIDKYEIYHKELEIKKTTYVKRSKNLYRKEIINKIRHRLIVNECR